MTREVAAAKPDAIAIVCTNMRGAPLAEELEAGVRHPDLRHGVDDGVEKPEGCRRGHQAREGLGQAVCRLTAQGTPASRISA